MKSKQAVVSILTGLSLLCLPSLSAQANTLSEASLIAQEVEADSPALEGNGNFSIAAGKQMMEEAGVAARAQNYTVAVEKYKSSRQLMNQLSNFYQGLATTFGGVDPLVSRSLRSKALETAELRDKSTYQLALVYRSLSQSNKAIPLLIEIVRSQSPSRDLGKRAYRQLLELGFVDTPYPRTPQTEEAS